MPKRWAVEPDYERPITRLQARLDPNIVIPPIQDLPRRKRRRRVEVNATAAAPPLQNAEDKNDRQNDAQQAPSGDQAEEMTTKDQTEVRMEEVQLEENTTENQIEEEMRQDQIEEGPKGYWSEVDLLSADLDDLFTDDLDGMENQIEEVTRKDQIEERTEGSRSEVNMVTESESETEYLNIYYKMFSEDDLEERTSENILQGQSEELNVDNQSEDNVPWPSLFDPSVPWTDKDQKDLEKEIEEEDKKPKNQRSYSWNLIVGIPGGSLPSSVAQDNRPDGQIALTNNAIPAVGIATVVSVPAIIDSPAKQNNPDSSSQMKTVEIAWNVSSPGMMDTMSAAMSNMSIAASRSVMEDRGMKERGRKIKSAMKEGLKAHQSGSPHQIPEKAGAGSSSAPQHHLPKVSIKKQEASDLVSSQLPSLQLSQPTNEINNSGAENASQPLALPSPVAKAPKKTKIQILSSTIFTGKADVITNRRFVGNTLFQEQLNFDHQFSVVSYNMMAELEKEETGPEGYSIGDGSGTERRSGRAKCQASTPPDLLPKNYNMRIIQELFFLNPDVFCLQSITDWYWFKLERQLNNWGYSGFRMCRRPGPCARSEALFFRTKRFQLIKSDRIYLDDLITRQSLLQDGLVYHSAIVKCVESPEVVTAMILQCRNTGRRFRVVNTRLAPKYRQRPDLQTAQVCGILHGLEMMNDRLPVILCGDFDSQPDEGPYQIVRDGSIQDQNTEQILNSIESVAISQDQKIPLSSAYSFGFQHSMTSIKSAYAKVLWREPLTVWKRESKTFVCGSYIWFDVGQLSVVGVLDMVPSRAITETGIPSDVFPSGSLSLKAVFQFSNDIPAAQDRGNVNES